MSRRSRSCNYYRSRSGFSIDENGDDNYYVISRIMIAVRTSTQYSMWYPVTRSVSLHCSSSRGPGRVRVEFGI